MADSNPDMASRADGFPLITAVKSSGEAVYLSYPIVRLVIFLASVVIGLGMWLVLNRTRIGMIVRAGVDDRDMLSAMGVPIQLVFVTVFAFGAGLAGMAGVVGGTFQSLSPGEDTRFLLASLIVVIVGGMGSIPGAALGAVIIGLAEQIGLALFPDLRDRSDLPDHGARAGRAAAGPAGGALGHGARRERSEAPVLTAAPPPPSLHGCRKRQSRRGPRRRYCRGHAA